MEKNITYVTGNWAKILSARQILEPLGFEIEQVKLDVPELQDDLIENVAKYSAKWASEHLKKTVLKNDSGICIDALNGFPGPYTHYVDDTLKEDGILKLLEGVENRKALAYHSMLLEGKLPLTIGGGIGQSRICMTLLEKVHIGEVQASVWPDEMIEQCETGGVHLL